MGLVGESGEALSVENVAPTPEPHHSFSTSISNSSSLKREHSKDLGWVQPAASAARASLGGQDGVPGTCANQSSDAKLHVSWFCSHAIRDPDEATPQSSQLQTTLPAPFPPWN